MDDYRQQFCSFCGKAGNEVNKLLMGPGGIFICDECVELCNSLIHDGRPQRAPERQMRSNESIRDLPTPKEIKEFLDEYIIGQDKAKKILSVAVYNHYKRIHHLDTDPDDDTELQKSNVLLIGPTGSGKTYLVQNLAKILNVPIAITDATSLTEAGYVGEDVENILLKLIQAADYDIAEAERGIIYIDEVDKIARKSENPSISRDVSGEGVQQALLKIIEGTQASVPPQGGRKHPHQECLQIDTTNILFICGGAFDGIENIIKQRTGKSSLGFGADVESKKEMDVTELLHNLVPQDLLKYGLIPEFVGRVPMIATIDKLDKDALIRIMREPKNSLIKQYQLLLKYDGVNLEFEDEAVSLIADKALELNTGARGLRSIVEETMLDIMYEVPSIDEVESVIVTKECISEGSTPKIVYKHKTSMKQALELEGETLAKPRRKSRGNQAV